MKYIKNCILLFLIILVFSPIINENHSTAFAASKPIIYIGDSRTEGMENCISKKDRGKIVFYAETSMGYEWFADDVVAKVTKQLKTYPSIDFKIVISLGINDHLGMIDEYVDKYNELAKNEWTGYEIDIISICPVDEEKMKANCLYPQTNASIEESNNYIIEHLDSENLSYIDLYSKMHSGTGLMKRYDTVYDGAHYTPDAYKKIWKLIRQFLGITTSK